LPGHDLLIRQHAWLNIDHDIKCLIGANPWFVACPAS
jgi:hypothetical protein